MAAQLQQTISVGKRGTKVAWLVKLGIILGIVILVAWVMLASSPQPSTATAPVMVASNPSWGIDLPAGAIYAQLPAGLRDYIRSNLPGLVPASDGHPGFGIDTPASAYGATLPAGLTDYMRDRSRVRTRGYEAAAVPVSHPGFGIDMPTGVALNQLPQGYREYIR